MKFKAGVLALLSATTAFAGGGETDFSFSPEFTSANPEAYQAQTLPLRNASSEMETGIGKLEIRCKSSQTVSIQGVKISSAGISFTVAVSGTCSDFAGTRLMTINTPEVRTRVLGAEIVIPAIRTWNDIQISETQTSSFNLNVLVALPSEWKAQLQDTHEKNLLMMLDTAMVDSLAPAIQAQITALIAAEPRSLGVGLNMDTEFARRMGNANQHTMIKNVTEMTFDRAQITAQAVEMATAQLKGKMTASLDQSVPAMNEWTPAQVTTQSSALYFSIEF